MKRLERVFVLILLAIINLHCVKKNTQITFTKENNRYMWFKNSKIQLKIDDSMGIKVFLNYDSGLLSLTRDREKFPKTTPSHFLVIDGKEIKDFKIINSDLTDITTKYGNGKRLTLKGIENNRKIEKELNIELYEDYPNIALTSASYKNTGSEELTIEKSYSNYFRIDESLVNPPNKQKGFWTFQGAAYKWGLDFTFELPDNFSRENYLGINDENRGVGGGIPLINVWCDKCGIAVGHIEPKPAPVCMPVNTQEDKSVEIAVSEKPEKTLKPGEMYNTVNTILIVHTGDFFNALKPYADIMKQVLPEFKKPPELAYKNEWCTWGFRRDFTVEKIYNLIPRIKELGISSIILDDGWFEFNGDWLPTESKFPNTEEDMKKFVRRLHDEGLKAWLWWTPFSTVKEGEMSKTHADWLIKNKDGKIHSSYDLCPAYQPVKEYHKKLVEKFVGEWDFDGFKLDFARINAAAQCYNPKHNHKSPWESYEQVPDIFRIIYETAASIKPDFLIEYCACSVPPSIYQMSWFHLPVTSDPRIDQITRRTKMYKALFEPSVPVLEEYCGVLEGPIYELIIGCGGVPGTFSTKLDEYHKKWLKIYQEHIPSKGDYLNLYDIGFDFPEGHVIKKGDSLYYAFYTNPWLGMEKQRRWRFGTEFDAQPDEVFEEAEKQIIKFSGKLNLRGLDKSKIYTIYDYANNKDLGTVKGADPYINVEFETYLLLKVTAE
ncbi:glycoside hydrolase family 36 protein [candidate division KSB1 bacterium]